MKRSNSNPSTLRKRKSFRGWLKRVSMPNAVVGKRSMPDMPRNGVFGIPLSVSITYARTTVGYMDEDGTRHTKAGAIPIIVAKCGSFLKSNGLDKEGIFRICGNNKRINELESQFDQNSSNYGLDLDWNGYTVHDAASVLRRFLNKLPDPVIPFEYYNPFRNVMNDKAYMNTDKRIEASRLLIQRLPPPHQHLLLYLLDMLSLFSSAATETKMDTSNLAAIFSPCILRHPDHNDPVQYKISQHVIEFLVEFQSLFTMQLLAPTHKKKPSTSPTDLPLLVSSHQPKSQVTNPSPPSPSFTQSPVDITPPSPVLQESWMKKTLNTTNSSLDSLSQNIRILEHELKPWLGRLIKYKVKPPITLVGLSIFSLVMGVILYEIYLAITLMSFEPFFFFIGLGSYWGLLLHGFPVEPDTAELSAEPNNNVMSEWSELLNRSWKTSDGPANDSRSTLSRFEEEEEGDEDSQISDDLGFDSETLEFYLAQYDQIKKDAALARELHLKEQQERDMTNPFLVDSLKESSDQARKEPEEEWKISVFPRT